MADDEQFSLCWNNFNSNLSAGFHDSLVQGDLVDVTLAAEGHLVKAHRLILSVCSPYFRKMFMQMPVNQHAFIFLKDVSHSVLKDLIQFMYCGEVNVKQEALPGFISTAEALQIKGLTETGDSAPPQASPAKEIPSTPAPVSISTSNTVSPRGKSQRTRAQSYKLESEESGDDKIVQIQTPASHHSVTVSQQVQQVQQLHVASGQKRVLGQRHVQPSQITKRAKISVSSTDVLDPSDNTTQIQTVQIVKQLPSQPAEPEYVDLAMESINTKAEPDYAEEPAEIETVEAETEQDQSLTENEQTVDQEQGDDGDQYVDDDAYGELSKYDESYFTEGEDGKPGASGFGESYASDGTSNEQASQDSRKASHERTVSVLEESSGTLKADSVKMQKRTNQTKSSTGKGRKLTVDSNQSSEVLSICTKTTTRPNKDKEPTVTGFSFPLKEKHDIERLEFAIQGDKNIRAQYINYLQKCMPKGMKIQNFLSSLFSDDALYAYNFHGCNASGKFRIPMKNYSVFFDCFLEAFKKTGLNDNELQLQLCAAVKHSRNRMRQRMFRARKHREKQFVYIKGEKVVGS
ncbi:modifier of mdg4-like isoform X2 [Anopheles albimanus]|uniref:modifier of mdg4-like isoform X2 n=1 Tax=Anopheles albimanus TaxID=7167 RepID=UPI00164194C7|nr:modifier of mdg4-like isoform X2 [Anopheles albimanus]